MHKRIAEQRIWRERNREYVRRKAHEYYINNIEKQKLYPSHSNKAIKLSHLKRGELYPKWCGMKRRCNIQEDKNYIHYGGRGVKIEWKSFVDFKNDMYESYLVHKKIHGRKNTTLDRINVNGNYSKGNCRWATLIEQANNRSNHKVLTYKGKILNITQWSKETGINRNTIESRIRAGYSIDRILNKKLFFYYTKH